MTRRHFTGLAASAAIADQDPRMRDAISRLEYLTPVERGYVLDKGKAGVADMTPSQLREAGLEPETWSLDISADPSSNSVIERPVSFRYDELMRLAGRHAVKFVHVCVCTNGNDPFHTTLWEGVPLREAVWLAGPKQNIRRVYYQSHHAPGLAPFQASLPLGQVLETPPGQNLVVLAYKMNGQPIPASHGGPVRVVVPGAYGNKSIKWVRRLVLTNDYRANDSDAELNNDVESSLKTRARFIEVPKEVAAGQAFAVTGMAQVGISGLSKVQFCIESRNSAERPQWKDAAILPAPDAWGGGVAPDEVPRPREWPVRFAIAHWAASIDGLGAGRYDLSCRTIDLNGIAQPLPRPLPRTGVTAIQQVELSVRG